MTLIQEIRNTFNQHAKTYESSSIVQQEIGHRLFERLDFLKINPRYVLDLGCGSGNFTLALKKRYPKAVVIALDLAFEMLLTSKKKQRLFNRWPLVNANMDSMPFADGTFDLIFANQAIHWSRSFDQALCPELNRIMATNGCLMFSTLGPDTFQELKQSWQSVDNHAHANTFIDMHDLGDILTQHRFLDPVVDMDYLTLRYPSVNALIQSLKNQGVKNIHPNRQKGLTGKSSWQAFETAYSTYQTPEGKIPLTYEVIYAHAWKGQSRITKTHQETLISIDSIKRHRVTAD